jgi:hypothetical protein
MSDPNNLYLLDDNKELHGNLKKVQYSSRYALGLFFSESDSSFFDKQAWDAKYISDNKAFRYVALDNKKRQQSKPLWFLFQYLMLKHYFRVVISRFSCGCCISFLHWFRNGKHR